MERPATAKVHFAPLRRQEVAIRKLLREHRHRNVTELMRVAIDHYLERLGRPPLSEQARQMADDFRAERGRTRPDPWRLQDSSRDSDEEW